MTRRPRTARDKRKRPAGAPGGPAGRAEARFHLANGFLSRGKLAEAEAGYRETLRLDPGHAAAHQNLGIVLKERGKFEEAAQVFAAALRLQPDNPVVCFGLGLTLHELGRFGEAEEAFVRALRLRPDFAEAHFGRGAAQKDAGFYKVAIESYRRVLRLQPGNLEALIGLGEALRLDDQAGEAAEVFQAVLAHRPESDAALCGLGSVQHKLGDYAGAQETFERLHRLQADSFEANYGLGIVLQEQNLHEQALEKYRRAVSLRPSHADAHHYMGLCLNEMGRFEEAVASFREALRHGPENKLLEFRVATFCPVILKGREELEDIRQRLEGAIDALSSGGHRFTVEEIEKWGPSPSFYLAYHGKNELPLRVKYAGLFSGMIPRQAPVFSGDSLPRVCFLVTKGHHGIFLRLMKGIILNLSREKFQVSVLCHMTAEGAVTSALDGGSPVEIHTYQGDLRSAARVTRNGRFDLICYFEAGTDPVNYFLPFFRLAPVQCAAWGYPVTSGIPEMDYFISSELLEPEDAPDHYSEELIRLKTFPVYYYRPPVSAQKRDRSDFGFSASDHIYACPQTVQKFHPDFDHPIGEILRGDKRGVLALAAGVNPRWNERLMERFRRTIPDVADRIRVIPWMAQEEFVSLLKFSDVLLDPMHYGGGNTTYEGLAMGTPLVTWPGAFMRGRVTSACYRKMGVMECVASSPEEYVEIALRLGTEPAYRESVKRRILDANHVLYEDAGAVRELEAFFLDALEKARRQIT